MSLFTSKKLIVLFVLCLHFLRTYSQVVNTQFGQIQGTLNGNVYQFLGIPFAKPPIDSLRWKAPRLPDGWNDILPTTAFAPMCAQKNFSQGDTTSTIMGSEDCLYLNVWTPQLGTGNKAVMVFIHGGGNQQGGASETAGGTQLYFGKNLSERGDVVVVTIQYRLGALGYLVHGGLEAENENNVSGNYGVLDQILALKWVQNNISNFGGDPSQVMIFGESAGGVNVGNLLTTPMAKGLFQRACIQSAAPVINPYQDSKNKGIAYVDKFINTGTDTEKIQYMRSLPADSLIKYDKSPVSGGAVQVSWQPTLDKVVFLDFPNKVFESGNFNKVPLMIGSNAEEMSLSAPPTVAPFTVNVLINTTVPQALRPQALALYPPGANATEARASYVAILTDAQFTSTTRRTAQCISLNQTEAVWRYFFTYKHSIPQLAAYGSYHGMELFYVFNNWENATLGSGFLFRPSDAAVQYNMLNYWVNFAKTGNPNGVGLEVWNPYQSNDDCYLEINDDPDGNQCGIRTEACNLWDNVVGFMGCKSTTETKDVENEISHSIYPNPTHGILEVSTYDGYEIYNASGMLLYKSSKACVRIDVTSLAPGLYILKTQSKAGWFLKI